MKAVPEVGVGVELKDRELAPQPIGPVQQRHLGECVLTTQHDHELATATRLGVSVPQLRQRRLRSGRRQLQRPMGVDTQPEGFGLQFVVVQLDVT